MTDRRMGARMRTWHGCYNSSWNGFITPESFAHPAKFARGLIERIFDHCLERGYLKRGDRVGDCFGGIGTGGIIAAYRGIAWIGCELEARFVTMAQANFARHESKWEILGSPRPQIVQGDSRNFDQIVGGVAAIVSSPPFGDQNDHERPLDSTRNKNGRHSVSLPYGTTPGQIGSLKSGTLDAVVSSPPYADSIDRPSCIDTSKVKKAGGLHSQQNHDIYGQTPGQIGRCKSGSIDAVISSPPYAAIAAGAGGLNTKPAKHAGQQSGRKAESASQDTDQKYGESDGQISRLKSGSLDAVVSSPPYEASLHPNETKEAQLKRMISKGQFSAIEKMSGNSGSGNAGYTNNPDNLGNASGQTYWQAVAQVYASCYRAIRPGGFIVLVLKDYVSKRKRVPLCDDTARLLEHCGFTVKEMIHAMLTEETRHADLFHGETVERKSRKSFFRRLCESKGSPEINWEEVIFAQKP